MPRVSKYHLSQQDVNNISDQFSYLVSSLKRKDQIEEFLHEFLTAEEKVMLAKRLVLCMLLTKNLHYKSIQNSLHISYETVRNYQHRLPFKSKEFHLIIKQLLQKDKTKQFMKKFENALRVLSLISESKTNMKARAKILSGEWT